MCPEHNCSELKGDTFAVKRLNTAPVRVRGEGELLPRALGTSTVTVAAPKPGYWAPGVCEELLSAQSSPYTEGAGGAASGPLQTNIPTVLNCKKCHSLETNQTL